MQYPDLASMFELRCLTIPYTDRSTFKDLINVVHAQLVVRAQPTPCSLLAQERRVDVHAGFGLACCAQDYRGRDLFIMGESFGGLLALGTVLDATKKGPNPM